MNTLKKILLSLMCFSFVLPQLAFAQGLKGGSAKLNNVAEKAYGGTPESDPQVIIGKIINAFLGLLGIVFLVLMVYAGFLWMTAQGEAEKVNTAKKLIVQAVIGLAIVLAAYAITSFVVGRLQEATVT